MGESAQVVGTRSDSLTHYGRPGSGRARRSAYPAKVDRWNDDRKKIALGESSRKERNEKPA